MKIIKIKTRTFLPPKDDIFKLMKGYLPKLKDRDILLISSKILAIHQGRCVEKSKKQEVRSRLIQKESEGWLPARTIGKKPMMITIKNNCLIPNAGIDESNGKNFFILWPKNINTLLKKIHSYLKNENKIKNLAIISVDSRTLPMRWGTVGISTGFYGFEPVKDYRKTKDIFNKKLKYTQLNLVDSVASMGPLFMGEGNEKIPMLIVRRLKTFKFTNKNTNKKLVMDKKKDIYYPLLKHFSAKGGSASGGKKS